MLHRDCCSLLSIEIILSGRKNILRISGILLMQFSTKVLLVLHNQTYMHTQYTHVILLYIHKTHI